MDVWQAVSTVIQGGVAVGTGALAIAAFRQLNWQVRRDAEARQPRLFFKDIWIAADPKTVRTGGKDRLELQVVTKNLANLSSYALAIHRLCILDREGNALARAHPMRVLAPGAAWKADDRAAVFVVARTPRNGFVPKEE